MEIGPGKARSPGCCLIASSGAIEIDRELAAALAAEFPAPRLALHVGDVLKFNSPASAGAWIVGNLPYNISTPILFHLAPHAARLGDLHFMLQLEVVERMVAKHDTPAYGRLSVMLQTRFAMNKLFNVSAGSFRPPPKEWESAVVRSLLPSPPDCDPAVLEQVVREGLQCAPQDAAQRPALGGSGLRRWASTRDCARKICRPRTSSASPPYLGVRRIRLNQSSDRPADSSASAAAPIANSAEISVSFFSTVSRRAQRVVDLLEVGRGAGVEVLGRASCWRSP